MAERESGEHHSRRRTVISAVGGAAAAAMVVVPLGLAIRHNDRATQNLDEVARTLAKERNTCTIQNARLEPSELGGPVLAVTVALYERVDPASRNQEFDRTGVDVTFVDETGNLISGMNTFRLGSDGKVEERVFMSRENEGPTSQTNTIEVDEPFLRIDNKPHRYSIQRQNAIRAIVDGPFVTNSGYTSAALVNCGTIEYDEHGHLTIIPPES